MVFDMPSPASPSRAVRVGHVPHDAPYVRRVTTHPCVVSVPPPSPTGPVLFADWVRQFAPSIDVLHLHVGLGDCPTVVDDAVVPTARALGLPLVATVHCLARAQESDAGLLTDPAVLLALTPVAAGEVRRRWGRDALVTSHPHVADPGRLHSGAPLLRPEGPWRLGLHLPGFDADTAAVASLDALAGLLSRAGADLLVEVRHTGRATEQARARLDDLARDPRVDVRAVPRTAADDRAAADWVAGLDLLLLAAVRGSQSAWLELCRDLGTGAVAGALPSYVQQGTVAAYPVADGCPSPAVIARAVERAMARVPVVPITAAARFNEAARVREEHAALYRAVVAAAHPRLEEQARGASPW